MRIWKVVAHSQVGTRHADNKKNNQDRYAFHMGRPADERLDVVIGDGAGSCSRAEAGAELAIKVVGSDLPAITHSLPRTIFEAPFHPDLKAQLQPRLQGSFTDLSDRMKKDAEDAHLEPDEFSTSVTAVIPGRHWLACISQGDVACVSGSPGNWTLVNRIIKGTPPDRAGPMRNWTQLLPYAGELNPKDGPLDPAKRPTSEFSLVPRKFGDLVLVFSDAAVSRFLIDHTPHLDHGSYRVNTTVLDEFYRELRRRLFPEAQPAVVKCWKLPDWLNKSQVVQWLSAGLTKMSERFSAAAPPQVSPAPLGTAEEYLLGYVKGIVDAGVVDDITVLTAFDVEQA